MSTVGSTDSVWSRSSSARKYDKGPEKNSQQADGAASYEKLDIEDDGHESVFNKSAIGVMDYLYNLWGNEYEDQDEEG